MHTPVEPDPEAPPETADESIHATSEIAPSSHDYYSWTRAIGEYYFRPEFDQKPIRIAFDDDVAEQIGRSIGADVASFIAAVGAVANNYISDVFRSANKPELTVPHYPYLGVLGAQVLTASRMGMNKDIDSTSFWGPFETMFVGGETLRASTRERFDVYWRNAQIHYAKLNLGRLTIQDDPSNVPLRGKVHINFPLWQVMLREADRAQLRAWLQTRRADDLKAPAALLAALLQGADGFNKTLRTTLQEAARDASVASALAPMFEEIRADVQAFTGRAQSRREKGRLRLVGRRSLQCFLQQRDESGRWFDVSAALDAKAVVYGTIDEITQTWWRGDDCIAFIDAGIEAFVAHRGDIAQAASVWLLFSDDDHRVAELLRDAPHTPIDLDQRLQGLRCVKISVVPERDDSILTLFGCSCLGERLLSITGGLVFRGKYLSTCLPRIRVRRPNIPISMDGQPTTVAADGWVDIRAAGGGGVHVVSAGRETIEFTVLNTTDLGDSEAEPIYGIAVGTKGVMHTTSLETFGPPATGMLVGAEYWDA
jgi:hypothetical protein